jgi:hypothetical protein
MPQNEVFIQSVGAKPNHFVQGAPNAAVVITLPTVASAYEFAGAIVWSYSAAPTGGRLTVAGGGFGIDIDIIAGGPGYIPFTIPQHATDKTPIVITLAAGGAGIIGKLNLLGVRMD